MVKTRLKTDLVQAIKDALEGLDFVVPILRATSVNAALELDSLPTKLKEDVCEELCTVDGSHSL